MYFIISSCSYLLAVSPYSRLVAHKIDNDILSPPNSRSRRTSSIQRMSMGCRDNFLDSSDLPPNVRGLADNEPFDKALIEFVKSQLEARHKRV
jgi:hypothetical protein